LCSRFVSAKNSGVPPTTTQRASTPAPRAYASSGRSISATPPPRAVELTFQTTRPASSGPLRSRAAANAAHSPGSISRS
jgi:hypothetical protein